MMCRLKTPKGFGSTEPRQAQLDCRVAEHVLGTTQSTHAVVVYIKSEAVEAKEHTHPVEVTDNGVPRFEHAVKHIIDVN